MKKMSYYSEAMRYSRAATKAILDNSQADLIATSYRLRHLGEELNPDALTECIAVQQDTASTVIALATLYVIAKPIVWFAKWKIRKRRAR